MQRGGSAHYRLRLAEHSDGEAPASLQAQHEQLVCKLEARRRQVRERVCAELGNLLPNSIETLAIRFEECGGCQRCEVLH